MEVVPASEILFKKTGQMQVCESTYQFKEYIRCLNTSPTCLTLKY
jgi:hypothetical protein